MDKLKSNLTYSLLFLLGLFPCIMQADQAKEIARLKLLLLLQEQPDLAERFLQKIEGRKVQLPQEIQPAITKQPVPPQNLAQPVTPALRDVREQSVQVEKPAISKPAVKGLITEGELSSLNKIFSVLETNAKSILSCLRAFFCRENCQPYQHHVHCLKSHLTYLKTNLVSQFPQPETAERQKVFGEFKKISTILERAETALLNVIDQQYGNGILAAGKLGKNFLSSKPLLDAWKKESNASINILKREIPAMQKQLETLRTHLNNLFDFGKDIGLEVMGIITHRLSR